MPRMRLLELCGAAVLGFTFGIGAAPAQEATNDKKFELKLSHWVPPTHPLQKAIEEWGADVEKASGGTITYKVFPSQQLGKAFDHYDMARDGIADFTYVNPGYQPGRFPIIAAGELPFLIGDAHGGIRAIDAWYRKYAANEMKDVNYCFSFILDPLTWHSKTKKIVVPGDIKGMKIRPSQATIAAWVTLLGGTNVQASAHRSPRRVGKGRGRGGDIPVGVDRAARRRQGHEVSHGCADPYDDVPVADESEAPMPRCRRHNRKSSTIIARPNGRPSLPTRGPTSNMPGCEKIKAMPGHEVYTITDEQLTEWKKSAEPLHKKWADNVRAGGGDPDVIMNELKASLAKYQGGLLMQSRPTAGPRPLVARTNDAASGLARCRASRGPQGLAIELVHRFHRAHRCDLHRHRRSRHLPLGHAALFLQRANSGRL